MSEQEKAADGSWAPRGECRCLECGSPVRVRPSPSVADYVWFCTNSSQARDRNGVDCPRAAGEPRYDQDDEPDWALWVKPDEFEKPVETALTVAGIEQQIATLVERNLVKTTDPDELTRYAERSTMSSAQLSTFVDPGHRPTYDELVEKLAAFAKELEGHRAEATRQEVEAAALLQWEPKGDPSLGPFDKVVAFAQRVQTEMRNANGRASKAEEATERHGRRIEQLETVLQSAIARAMKMVSASSGQAEKAAVAERIARVLEDYEACHRFFNERETPGADTLLERIEIDREVDGVVPCGPLLTSGENPGSRPDDAVLGVAYEVADIVPRIGLTVRFPGESLPVSVRVDQRLGEMFASVLVELGMGKRRVGAFDLTDSAGAQLDPRLTIAELKLESGADVYARDAAASSTS